MTAKHDDDSCNSQHTSSILSLEKFIWSFLVCTVTVIVLIGSLYNISGHKYSKAKDYPGCHKSVLNLNINNSVTCCDNNNDNNNWICSASYDYVNKIFASIWSLLIPLIPFFVTVVTDYNNSTNYGKHCKRLLVYVVIILIRMVIFIIFIIN